MSYFFHPRSELVFFVSNFPFSKARFFSFFLLTDELECSSVVYLGSASRSSGKSVLKLSGHQQSASYVLRIVSQL